jgi:diguanylate cyclase (GGDEF)-like protein
MLNNLIKNLKKSLTSIIPNGGFLARDFEYIDAALQISPSQFENEKQFSDFLPEVFNDISENVHVNVKFYGAVNNRKLKWFAQLGQFKYAELIESKSNEIFKTDVAINHINTLMNVNQAGDPLFVSVKINNKYFYVIEIEVTKWQNYYARIFYSSLLRLITAYKDHVEKTDLKNQLSTAVHALNDTQKSLQIAEKAVKRKVYDLHNLVEASNEIYSILNFRQLINSALLTVVGQIGVQSAFVLMYDQTKRSYSQVYQKGYKAKEIQKLKFRIDSPLVKYFTGHNIPVYVRDLAKQQEFQSYVDKLSELGVFIIAPIIFSERMQGIIATGEKLYSSDFSQTDFELFHVLVNIISISIENSLHYEAVKNLSLTDEMTKLHNYRSFISRLKEEINRAKRNKARVSLVILDIDHFKNYNDTLGHQAGDEALREVGKVLRKTVRDEDIVSRYGGEEFCVIFPGIASGEIQNLGERIRQKIERHKFYKEKVQPHGQLTVSLGGASYPEDAAEIHELIQKADEALYLAKHLGRNQLQIYNFAQNDK